MLKLAMKNSDATMRIQNHEDTTAEPKDIHILSINISLWTVKNKRTALKFVLYILSVFHSS